MNKILVKESLSDYVKPKSKDEIKKTLGNLSPQEKLKQGCKHGILWLVKEALKEGADPSDDYNGAIRWASNNNHTNVVKLLLQDPRVDPSDNNNLAIRWASSDGHTDVVKLLLLDKRVDPSDYNNLAIKGAEEENYLDIVKLLIQDKRVRNKLTLEKIQKYENIVKYINK